MNELALFAGAGGGILGGKLLGWRTVCAVELDPYAASVLIARQNDGILRPFPIWDDICTFDGRSWNGIVDVVSCGFPCPAFSCAASGNNKAEKDLWHEAVRVISEVQPTIVFGENVAREAINKAAEDLHDMGYDSRACEMSASDLGSDHIRKRYWLLAYPHDQGELLRKIYAKASMLPELLESVWKTYPGEPRMVDGVAGRVDRFKAIGNGQVPIVAASAFLVLAQQ